MAAVLPAVLLGVLPGVSPAEVPVAVAMELPPGVVAALCVCKGQRGRGKLITADIQTHRLCFITPPIAENRSTQLKTAKWNTLIKKIYSKPPNITKRYIAKV